MRVISKSRDAEHYLFLQPSYILQSPSEIKLSEESYLKSQILEYSFNKIMNSNFCKENWPSNLPKGFIHADMFPDNVFFKDNEISGVIDYYFSCTDFLVYDIAIALNAWCFNDVFLFSKDKCNSLIEGYRSIRKLTKAGNMNKQKASSSGLSVGDGRRPVT